MTRLHKIIAVSDQQAMMIANKLLGPNALIYSTTQTSDGVEMIAGTDDNRSFKIFPVDPNSEVSDIHDNKILSSSNNDYLELRNDIRIINEKLNNALTLFGQKSNEKTTSFDNIYKDYLNKPYNFSTKDIYHDAKIVALVGPTGTGKTTTALKIAKKFISENNSDQMAIITTDYREISERNLYQHYKKIFNIDIEYASNADELNLLINAFKEKSFVLIDTNGINHKDRSKLSQLKNTLDVNNTAIQTYITIPCSYQLSIVDNIVNSFMTDDCKGFILTKADEADDYLLTVKHLDKFRIPISYVCNGQDINKDIYLTGDLMSHMNKVA